MGMAVSQAEAPFSLACSIAVCWPFHSFALMMSASSVAANRLCDQTVAFASLCSACACSGKAAFCRLMSETNGSETLVEASNWLLAYFIGLRIPRLPCLAGKASSSRSASLKACLPVKAERKLYRIASSRGCNSSSISGRHEGMALFPVFRRR